MKSILKGIATGLVLALSLQASANEDLSTVLETQEELTQEQLNAYYDAQDAKLFASKADPTTCRILWAPCMECINDSERKNTQSCKDVCKAHKDACEGVPH